MRDVSSSSLSMWIFLQGGNLWGSAPYMHRFDDGQRFTQDPTKVLTSWNHSFHFCEWSGISCGKRHKRVTILRLDSQGLEGSLSPHVGNLSFLRTLSIKNNSFQGTIPHELGRLARLRVLYLDQNKFSGLIPSNLSRCSNLEVLWLGENKLAGSIPKEMSLLSKLVGLSIEEIACGAFPRNPSFGSLVKARTEFYLWSATYMEAILFQFNLSLLDTFSFYDNQLTGSLPSKLGVMLPNLEILQLYGNKLTGVLPPSISNLLENYKKKKIFLGHGENNFSGKLKIEFSKLRDINEINLANNNFHGRGEADDLTFIDSLKNCTNLEKLILYNCNLIGVIPISIGPIPDAIGNLSLLNKLFLASNELEGLIPSSLGKCKELTILSLPENRLGGKIPKQILQLPSLNIALDLSVNNLSGIVPLEIKDLKMLSYLDLSYNYLSGTITSSLGECISLTAFILNGKIPQFLEKWKSLEFLNLSFNDFEGEVPIVGVFANASAFSVLGNNRLCGGLVTLELPKCKEIGSKKKRFPFFLLLILIVPTFLVVIYCSRLNLERFLKVSYNELLKATDGFSTQNLIGEGGFGSVYKGTLNSDDDRFVAVKVLHLRNRGALKSFLAECEAWRNIRRRNLLKIITSCSSVDFKGNDFKAMVYEFMPNGCVHGWLHSSTHTSKHNILQRINILRDVATALDYLHNRCQTRVVHGDLKPSNILQDADMVAHVGDFGLARLLGTDLNQDSSTGVKGTIGYAPPEFGLGSEMTSIGDVYSFGILLLEVMTGKNPTDGMFNEGLSLHKFAYMALPDHVIDVIDDDAIVLQSTEANAKKVKECMAAIIKIGVSCSVDSPPQRMKIEIVVNELQRIIDFCQFGNVTPPPKLPFEETTIEGIFYSFFSVPSFVIQSPNKDGWEHHAPGTNLDDSRWLNPAALPPKIYPPRPVRASRSTFAAEEGDAVYKASISRREDCVYKTSITHNAKISRKAFDILNGALAWVSSSLIVSTFDFFDVDLQLRQLELSCRITERITL
ncbi:kinase-like domain-containing protein [Tanacetum coccineum]